MFRHLREDALSVLGGGTAAFMRLGHHGEAEQAASYIGRQHKFVLSQLTATLGGNETHTWTDTETSGVTDAVTFGSSQGWTEDHLEVGSRNGGLTHSRGLTASRNWSVAQSWATGTNWSSAAAAQRVYEFAVEPSVLQHLPDYALLLTRPGRVGSDLRAVECDPAIVTLPGVSTLPLSSAHVPVQIHPANHTPDRPGPAGEQPPLARAGPRLVIPQTLGGPPAPPQPLASRAAGLAPNRAQDIISDLTPALPAELLLTDNRIRSRQSAIACRPGWTKCRPS